MSDVDTREWWQERARDTATQSLLDLAVTASGAARSFSVLARALGVVPLYCPQDGGTIPTSVLGSGDGGVAFVHLYTTPLRLTTGWGDETAPHTVVETLLPSLAKALPPGTGVRLDPGLDREVVLSPGQAWGNSGGDLVQSSP